LKFSGETDRDPPLKRGSERGADLNWLKKEKLNEYLLILRCIELLTLDSEPSNTRGIPEAVLREKRHN